MAKPLLLSSMTLACSMALSGCAVGPDFKSAAPAVQTPAQFSRQEARAGTDAAPLPSVDVRDAAFWREFGDDTLTALVRQALGGNHDLGAALARLQAADAVLNEAQMERFPTVTMNAGATQQKQSQDQLSPGQPRSTRSYNAGIAAQWEVDLFGRVRRAVEAQQAQRLATQADLAALQVVIAAQVADSYAQLRGTQLRLQVAQANARNQRDTLQLVERRLQAGMATDLDASRARALLLGTEARLPNLQAQAAVLQHRLAVLAGLPPGDLIAMLDSAQELPRLPAVPRADTPGELLRRRPDIAAAEARLHAATARVGVATADLFPRLSIGGLLGSFALGGNDLFKGSTATSSVFLGVDWSFLDVGRVRARIAASEAGAAESLAQYQQSVLQALEETENALVRANRSREELQVLTSATQQRDKASKLAQRMYQGGTIGLYEVLDAQREQLAAQDASSQSQVEALRNSIAVYKALAGGWQAGGEVRGAGGGEG